VVVHFLKHLVVEEVARSRVGLQGQDLATLAQLQQVTHLPQIQRLVVVAVMVLTRQGQVVQVFFM
jgi:hypothetical protein